MCGVNSIGRPRGLQGADFMTLEIRKGFGSCLSSKSPLYETFSTKHFGGKLLDQRQNTKEFAEKKGRKNSMMQTHRHPLSFEWEVSTGFLTHQRGVKGTLRQ